MTVTIYYKGTLAVDCCTVDTGAAGNTRMGNGHKLFISSCNRVAIAVTGDIPSKKSAGHLVNMLADYISTFDGNVGKAVANQDKLYSALSSCLIPKYFICITTDSGFYIGTNALDRITVIEPDSTYFTDGSNSIHADAVISWLETKEGKVDLDKVFRTISLVDFKVTREYMKVNHSELTPFKSSPAYTAHTVNKSDFCIGELT